MSATTATSAAVSSASGLFAPLPSLNLSHRIVMAPLTRIRGTNTFACGAGAVEYYSSRASAGGLLITEGSPISPETQFQHAAGIYTDEQEEAWKKVVDAVHAKGGLISIQLWHLGRMVHASWANNPFLVSLNPPSLPSVSASATTAPGGSRDVNGNPAPYLPARALTKEEIETRLVADYAAAATRARRAGFDFIEIHAAHGYLLDQFFNDETNLRTDEYGTKTLEDRTRALGLVLKAVLGVYDASRVGIRVSPTTKDTFAYQGSKSADPLPIYQHVVSFLNQFRLGYLLISEPRWNGGKGNFDPFTDPTYSLPSFHAPWLRQHYDGVIIGSSSFTPDTADEAVRSGAYDAVAFGRFFISNPDFVDRVRNKQALNVYDVTTFYIYDQHRGYNDYPTLKQHDAMTEEEKKKWVLIESKQIGAAKPTPVPAAKIDTIPSSSSASSSSALPSSTVTAPPSASPSPSASS